MYTIVGYDHNNIVKFREDYIPTKDLAQSKLYCRFFAPNSAIHGILYQKVADKYIAIKTINKNKV